MRIRVGYISLVALLALLFLGLRPYDAFLGTWKLNLGGNSTKETRYSPGFPVPQSQTRIFEPVGNDGYHFKQDTVGTDGKSTHVEFTAQLDGKEYPVTGDPENDTVVLKRLKPHIVEGAFKKAGQVTSNFTIVLWGSGLLMTVESKDVRNGQTYENREVYNKLVPSL